MSTDPAPMVISKSTLLAALSKSAERYSSPERAKRALSTVVPVKPVTRNRPATPAGTRSASEAAPASTFPCTSPAAAGRLMVVLLAPDFTRRSVTRKSLRFRRASLAPISRSSVSGTSRVSSTVQSNDRPGPPIQGEWPKTSAGTESSASSTSPWRVSRGARPPTKVPRTSSPLAAPEPSVSRPAPWRRRSAARELPPSGMEAASLAISRRNTPPRMNNTPSTINITAGTNAHTLTEITPRLFKNNKLPNTIKMIAQNIAPQRIVSSCRNWNSVTRSAAPKERAQQHDHPQPDEQHRPVRPEQAQAAEY